jgi:hypothetical protein
VIVPRLTSVAESFFPLSYSSVLLPLFTVIGLGPRQSGAWVSQESVRVVMGWGFRSTFPRSSVQKIGPESEAVMAWGVHGWGGRWLVNGSSSGVVRVDIEPAAKAWIVAIPVKLKTLWLSVTSPRELVDELGGHR